MHRMKWVTAATALSLAMSGVVWAAEQGARSAPASGEATPHRDPQRNESATAEVDNGVPQDLDVGQPPPSLKTFLADMHQKFPNFQAVTAGNQEVWDRLFLPPMHLSKVNLAQVLHVLGDVFPGLEIKPEQVSGSQPVFVFNIPQGYVPGYSGEGNLFQVVGLADAVERQVLSSMVAGQADANTPKARKLALDQVLSLIKEAVKEADPSAPPPDMKIHDETQTLLLKGNNKQLNAVSSVLQVLSRHQGPVDEMANLYQIRSDLTARLKKADDQLEDMRKRLLERDEQVAQLQAALGTTQTKTNARGKE